MAKPYGKRFFRLRSFLLVLVCAVLVGSYYRYGNFQQNFIAASEACAAPFIRVYVWFLGVLDARAVKAECYNSLRKHVAEYKDTYEKLLADYIALHQVQTENKQVLLDREFLARYDTSYMVRVHVIQRIKTSREQALIVDAGSRRGVTDAMCAVYKNCLLGRVVAVSPHHSKIMLGTDPRSCIAAFASESGAQGILRGCGSRVCSLDFVSHLQKVDLGMLLVASGEGCVYPRGFGLARIDKVTKADDDLYYHISASPLIDPFEVEYCYIVQKGSEYKDDQPMQPEVLADLKRLLEVKIQPSVCKNIETETTSVEKTQNPEIQPVKQEDAVVVTPAESVRVPEN